MANIISSISTMCFHLPTVFGFSILDPLSLYFATNMKNFPNFEKKSAKNNHCYQNPTYYLHTQKIVCKPYRLGQAVYAGKQKGGRDEIPGIFMNDFLSDSEIMKVYEKDEKRGKDLMVCKHTNYIWYVIHTYYPTYLNEKEDLFQQGAIGLMRAMKTYCPERGRFTTYATRFMRKEMNQHINFMNGEQTPYYAELHFKVVKAKNAIEKEGREASVEEIMESTGLSCKIVSREMKVDYVGASLDEVRPEGTFMHVSDTFVLEEYLSGIPAVNQTVVRMKAVEGKSFTDISKHVGMSVSYVRQMYHESIETLSKQM